MIFITHNLALVRAIAQTVVVMCEGRLVEAGPVDDVLECPSSDYTKRLIKDVPKLLRRHRSLRRPRHPSLSSLRRAAVAGRDRCIQLLEGRKACQYTRLGDTEGARSHGKVNRVAEFKAGSETGY